MLQLQVFVGGLILAAAGLQMAFPPLAAIVEEIQGELFWSLSAVGVSRLIIEVRTTVHYSELMPTGCTGYLDDPDGCFSIG